MPISSRFIVYFQLKPFEVPTNAGTYRLSGVDALGKKLGESTALLSVQ